MSEHQAAPPQHSPDGCWWWDGQQWVPVTKPGPSTTKIVLLVLAGLGALLVLVVVVIGSLLAPVGTQHDTSEVEGYCEFFPEDC